jgi:hypothetical protein
MKPFALEWTELTLVFGQVREIPAHDFCDSAEEAEAQIKRLRAKGIVQVTRYKRVNGALVEQGESK